MPGQNFQQQTSSALTSRELVMMRVGLPGQQCVRMLHHCLRHMRVQIESGNDRDFRSDCLSHSLQQVSFQIACIRNVRRSRTMQRQKYTVQRSALLDPLQQFLLKVPVALRRDRATRTRTRHQQRKDFGIVLTERLQHAPDSAAGRVQELVAKSKLGTTKRFQIGRDTTQMIALDE